MGPLCKSETVMFTVRSIQHHIIKTYGRGVIQVSIKSFPDYKHLLQENYVEYKLFFLRLLKFLKFYVMCLL